MLGWILLGAAIGIAIAVTVEVVREEMRDRHVTAQQPGEIPRLGRQLVYVYNRRRGFRRTL